MLLIFERSKLRKYILDFNGALSDLEMSRKLDVEGFYSYDHSKAEIYKTQGEAFEIMGDRDRAIRCLSLAIKLRPNDLLYYEKRGELRYWNKDFKGLNR